MLNIKTIKFVINRDRLDFQNNHSKQINDKAVFRQKEEERLKIQAEKFDQSSISSSALSSMVGKPTQGMRTRANISREKRRQKLRKLKMKELAEIEQTQQQVVHIEQFLRG